MRRDLPARLLPTLVLVVALTAACGSGTEGGVGATGASTPSTSTPSPSNSPSLTPLSSAPPTQDGAFPVVVDLVAAAAAGGEVTRVPTPIGTDDEQARYLDGFEPRMTEQVVASIRSLAPAGDLELTATVVALGCEVPEDVVVQEQDGGWRVRAVASKTAPVQCLVPVTTIALVLLPS